MRVVDGNRDYLLKEKDFISLYNDNHYYTVKEIRKKLGLSLNEFRRLRDKCKEDGTIELRPAYRPKKEKPEPKFYSICYRGLGKTTYQICKQEVYYCKANSVREAELLVERLKECDWNKSQVPRIKKEVKELMRNE